MRNYDFTNNKLHHLIFSLIILLINFIPVANCIAQGEFQYQSTEIKQTPWENDSTILMQWAADVNGDSYMDNIVLGGTFPPTPIRAIGMKLLINDGSGVFYDGTSQIIPDSIPSTIHPREIAVSDFNGDGNPDIFIASHGYDTEPFPGEQNILLLSSQNGTLVDKTATLPQYIDFSHSVAVGDVEGDGDIDIYVGNVYGGNEVLPYLLINDGEGDFTLNSNRLPASLNYLTSSKKYVSSAFVDIDNDGDFDLLLGGDHATASIIFYNDGSGFFSDSEIMSLPFGPFGENSISVDIVNIDINLDGKKDIIQSQTGSNPPYVGRSIQVLIQKDDQTFVDESATRIENGHWFSAARNWFPFLVPIDFNNDGFTDLLCQNLWGDSLDEPFILLNDGNGNFKVLTHENFSGVENYKFLDLVAIPDQKRKYNSLLAVWREESNLQWSTYKRKSISGDINNDWRIDLTDAILTLKLMSNIEPPVPVFKEADINNDGKIGFEEAINALQVEAGIRP